MRVIRMHARMPRTCTPRTHAEGAWRNDRTYLRVRPGGDEDGDESEEVELYDGDSLDMIWPQHEPLRPFKYMDFGPPNR